MVGRDTRVMMSKHSSSGGKGGDAAKCTRADSEMRELLT